MDVEFYKTASGREVVAEFLDTGFTKKTQKTPLREIQTAKTRLADYEARYGTAYS